MKQAILKDPIAILVLILGFAYLFCISFLPNVRTDNNGVTIAVIGFIGIILNYLYGSSKGSAAKDATLNNVITDKKPVVENANNVTVQ